MVFGNIVHLLDVGQQEYGDALLCVFGNKRIMIDAGHPGDEHATGDFVGIAAQLAAIFGHGPPFMLDLLVVSHAHLDHIGCLPALVTAKTVSARWALVADPDLGWGRTPGHPPPDAPQNRADVLVAALREAPVGPRLDDDALDRWLSDAAGLESTYRAMITSLEAAGTRVVRLGQDDPTKLVKALRSTGLRIIGPSQAQLLACADAIRTSSDALAATLAAGPESDLRMSRVDAYRRLTGSADASDTTDAVSRLGAAVNLQSSVVTLEVDGSRFLFAGDMQFAQPGVGGIVPTEIGKLRALVTAAAPFTFAKLSHHGSDNAVDSQWLDALGATPLVGICAGSGSTKHPNPGVLHLLDQRRGQLTWGRTDRNGAVVVSAIAEHEPVMTGARGSLDDARPNAADSEVAAGGGPPSATATVTSTSIGSGSVTGGDTVELVARIPTTVTRVQIAVEIGETRPSRGGDVGVPATTVVAPGGAVSGVKLPRLLYVTSPDALRSNIGQAEATSVLADLAGRPGQVLELPAGLGIAEAATRVANALRPEVVGVVLIGGYDVVASQRVDVLPVDLRGRVDTSQDADNFVVWSDDIFGDSDGDGLPELPVSRIPDGHASELVLTALGQPESDPPLASRGLRNVARPFADGIYTSLPDRASMLVSAPVTFQSPALDLAGRYVYLMLHGDYVDGSRFWGEQTAGDAEAMNVHSVPPAAGAVVLAGACWGALTADTPAARVVAGRPFGHRIPDGSIALTFIRHGARAFVGCTGSHYSPLDPPFSFYGGPLHQLFWQSVGRGMAPAAALLAAKQAYIPGIPHGPSRAASIAIELKIWREFTCLGLGW